MGLFFRRYLRYSTACKNNFRISRKTFRQDARCFFLSSAFDELDETSVFLDVPPDVILQASSLRELVDELNFFCTFRFNVHACSFSIKNMLSSSDGSEVRRERSYSQNFLIYPTKSSSFGRNLAQKWRSMPLNCRSSTRHRKRFKSLKGSRLLTL